MTTHLQVNVNAILEMSAVPEVEGFVALPGRFTDLTTDTLLIVPESFREALEGVSFLYLCICFPVYVG